MAGSAGRSHNGVNAAARGFTSNGGTMLTIVILIAAVGAWSAFGIARQMLTGVPRTNEDMIFI
jgi:hypothetical protein